MILLEKDLDVLADGVAEGRRIFANTIKYVLMGTSSNFGNMFSAAGASLFLSFLPMLPSQILLNNLLYDSSQLAIPTDNVDEEQLRRPSHWDIGFIRRFMIFFGPLSSVFDFVTFGVMLWVFHAGAGAVPLRLVRRVAGHPDPGDLRDPHPADPVLPQPPEPAAHPRRARRGRASALCCPPHRWRTPSASARCRARSSPRWPAWWSATSSSSKSGSASSTAAPHTLRLPGADTATCVRCVAAPPVSATPTGSPTPTPQCHQPGDRDPGNWCTPDARGFLVLSSLKGRGSVNTLSTSGFAGFRPRGRQRRVRTGVKTERPQRSEDERS